MSRRDHRRSKPLGASRSARLLRQRLAAAFASTVQDSLSDGDVVLRLHPRHPGLIEVAALGGLTSEASETPAVESRNPAAREQPLSGSDER